MREKNKRHEIVLPSLYELRLSNLRANSPECAAWFNEGLASLYELQAKQ